MKTPVRGKESPICCHILDTLDEINPRHRAEASVLNFGGQSSYGNCVVKWGEAIVGQLANDIMAKPASTTVEDRPGGPVSSNFSRSNLGSSIEADSVSSRSRGSKSRIRLPISYRGISEFVASLDIIIILSSALISGAFYSFTIVPVREAFSRDMAAAVFVAVIFVSATSLRRLYDPSMLGNLSFQVRYVLGAWCGTFLLVASGVLAWGAGRELSRGTVLLFWAAGGVGLLVHRAFWRAYLPVALTSGALKGRNAIVVTWDEPSSAAFKRSMARHGYSLAAQLVVTGDDKATSVGIKNLIDFARGTAIDDIFLVPRNRHSLGIGVVTEALRVLPFPVTLIPDEATAQLLRSPSYDLGPHLAVEVQRAPLSVQELAFKRTFDIVIASFALLAALPFLVAVAVAIAMESDGPVLFRQTRHGFNGRPFKIFKFRTMTVLEDGENVGQAKRGDRRVTRIGTWLRRTSIDELPQLLNVLRGEMSIVGPRPHAAAHDKYFEKCIDNYAYRHHVKSGITGWAQVHGARGETDTIEKMQKRVDLDLWYIEHWSPRLDFSILLRTVTVVFSGRNAF